jgi:hypothetical protein
VNLAAPTAPPPLPRPLQALGALALLALAGWLGLEAWERNLAESCRLEQWPHLARCAAPADETTEQQVAKLRQRLARNPGDTDALVALATYAELPGGIPGTDTAAVIAAAEALAPQNAVVLRLQANRALQARQWAEGLRPLIKLSHHHHDADAARALTQLIAQIRRDPALETALREAARADPAWLPRVLTFMTYEKVPMIRAMPLVSEMIDRQQLPPATGQFVIRHLKAGGHWLDAHAIWLHLWKKPLGLLFNGDFEEAFIPDGFDWEILDTNINRAGARVYLSGRGERGQVLQVVFNGKALPQPVLRQHMLLLPGSYRFSGDYLTTDLRSAEGLGWVLSCATGAREIGRTPALKGDSRQWQRFDIRFTVPRDCGLGVALALSPHAAYEAKTGLRGEALFDRFQLVQE